jgi:hypothetical protein
VQEIEGPADHQQHRDAETDDQHERSIPCPPEDSGPGSICGERGKWRSSKGVDLLDFLPLRGRQDDDKDRFQDEEEEAVEDSREDSKEDPPDQAALERFHVAEEAFKDSPTIFGKFVRSRFGKVESPDRLWSGGWQGHDGNLTRQDGRMHW